ncbi:MAG: hypothetical protein AB8G99_21185, partial [Planctomycetaceae bacterium]
RLAISLCLAIATFGALAKASDNGYQKKTVTVRKVGLKHGFRKATTSAPDPTLRQVEEEPVQQQKTAEQPAVETPPTPAAPAASPPINTQIPTTPDDGGTPPKRPTAYQSKPATIMAAPAVQKPAISFMAPRPIAAFSEGCTDPQCQTCQPRQVVQPSQPNRSCQICETQQVQRPCATCSPTAPCADCQQGQQNQNRWRLFRKRQRRPRMNRRQTVSERRRQWWPWLATNDMPAPQPCQCPACSGVPASGCTTNVAAPKPVLATSNVDHEFRMLEEFSESAPTPIVAKPSAPKAKVLRGTDFGPLDAAEETSLRRVAKRISRSKIFPLPKRQQPNRQANQSAQDKESIGIWRSR